MTNETLKNIVVKSLKKLCEKDILLIDSAVKEECINHKLAQYIEIYTKCHFSELSAIDVDVEYNQYKQDPKKKIGQIPIRPDIIVHKRQSGNSNNYLAVEAKKGYSSKHDREKIQHIVKSDNFNYTLGCLVSYQPDRNYLIIQFLERGSNNWEKLKYRKQPFEII